MGSLMIMKMLTYELKRLGKILLIDTYYKQKKKNTRCCRIKVVNFDKNQRGKRQKKGKIP